MCILTPLRTINKLFIMLGIVLLDILKFHNMVGGISCDLKLYVRKCFSQKPQAYWELSLTCTMELFCSLSRWLFSQESSIADVQLSSKYASEKLLSGLLRGFSFFQSIIADLCKKNLMKSKLGMTFLHRTLKQISTNFHPSHYF